MDNKGKVSIIMPVYNTEEFLGESIKSVLNQTYANIEFIIIDDNSSDKSLERIKSYLNDERIKLVENITRKGVGYCRNIGIAHATGEYIYFIDSDDFIDRKAIEILINNIKGNVFIKGQVKTTTFSNAMAILFDGLFKSKVYVEDKYNLIKNRSSLNCLIEIALLKEHDIKFTEHIEAFSDIPFMIALLQKIDAALYLKEAIYFRRKRNDPINNPSIIQGNEQLVIKDYLSIHIELRQQYSEDSLVKNYLDKDFLNFYWKTILPHFKTNDTVALFFEQLVFIAKQLDSKLVNNQSWHLKKEVTKLKETDQTNYKKIVNKHWFLKDLKGGLKSRGKFYIFLYKNIFTKLQINERVILFESFLGKSYSDSPKYIYEYMLNNNMNYKFVWSVNEKREIPGNAIQVKRFSLKYFYYLAKAKYWVTNARLPRYVVKKDENVYVQTWHGTPLKKMVFDITDIHSADPNHKTSFYNDSQKWSYLSSPNEYSSTIFKRAFKFEKKMLEYGYPRNDILYQKNNAENIKALKQKVSIPTDKKVILYAPTWRDNEFFTRGKYKFSLHLDLKKLQEQFGDTHILLLRTHYHISNQIDISAYEGFVFDRSKYDDIAELYLISDILITDYSSVFFDYAHLKRPILFYTYDLNDYRDTLRGLYFDMEEYVPGPLLMDTNEVVNAISNIEDIEKNYAAKYEAFYDEFCSWDDGRASENTVKEIFKL